MSAWPLAPAAAAAAAANSEPAPASASVCLVHRSAVLVAAAVGEGDTADFRGGEGDFANSPRPVQQTTSAYSVQFPFIVFGKRQEWGRQ